MSDLNIKAIGLKSRSNNRKCKFCYLGISLNWIYLSKVKVKVIPKYLDASKMERLTFHWQTKISHERKKEAILPENS